MDIVRYIRNMRMHGLALRLLMNNEQKTLSGWLGYQRDLTYVNDDFAEEVIKVQDLWNQADNVSNREKILIGDLKHLLGWEMKEMEDE